MRTMAPGRIHMRRPGTPGPLMATIVLPYRGHTQGVPRAWRLTPRGEEIVRVGRPRSERTNGHPDLPEVLR
jgi:hypothetical protein